MGFLTGKRALIVGVATDRSIAGFTGEITYVDTGFNTVGMSFPDDEAAG